VTTLFIKSQIEYYSNVKKSVLIPHQQLLSQGQSHRLMAMTANTLKTKVITKNIQRKFVVLAMAFVPAV
jgi:hypothetical protein